MATRKKAAPNKAAAPTHTLELVDKGITIRECVIKAGDVIVGGDMAEAAHELSRAANRNASAIEAAAGMMRAMIERHSTQSPAMRIEQSRAQAKDAVEVLGKPLYDTWEALKRTSGGSDADAA